MYQYPIILSFFLFNICIINAQQDVITGTLETTSSTSVISKIASTEEHYYFVTHNQRDGKRPTGLFKTTLDFEIVDKIENLLIRGAEAEYLSFFQIISDRILMVSNAETEGGSYIYTHSLDLDFGTHTILDSLPKNIGEEFAPFEYKSLNDNTFFAIGNISRFNTTDYLSTHYFEFDSQGKINKFEAIGNHRAPVITFDYQPNMNQYFFGELCNFNLANSNFEIIDSRKARLPISLDNSPNVVLNISSCNFTDSTSIECIGSSSLPAGTYSNFATQLNTAGDSVLYESAIPLHPDTIENLRTRLVHTTVDDQGNRYFAYYEPFNPVDFEVVPNKIFISKFDKDFQNIYFLEFLDSQEHGFEDVHIDQQGNLIIAGATLTPELGVFNNSFIKISENGELLTSTGSISLPETIDIYPNPTTDFINLNIDQPTTDIKYFIYALDGRQKAHGNISFGANLSVNTQELPAGMYILHAEYDNQIRVAKFLKK